MLRVAGCLAVLLVGCYSPKLPEGASCMRDSQCPLPQRCVDGSCSTRDGIDAAIEAPVDAIGDAVLDAALPEDAPAIDAPLPCTTLPLGADCEIVATMCGGRCWVRCAAAKNHDNAAAACATWSGHLGEIDDADEQLCVASARGGGELWIGAVQALDQTSAGLGWTWNGDPAKPLLVSGAFQNWPQGKPDDGANGENNAEQCAEIGSGGVWNDAACGGARPYFCER